MLSKLLLRQRRRWRVALRECACANACCLKPSTEVAAGPPAWQGARPHQVSRRVLLAGRLCNTQEHTQAVHSCCFLYSVVTVR
jgi:hypothetical protein